MLSVKNHNLHDVTAVHYNPMENRDWHMDHRHVIQNDDLGLLPEQLWTGIQITEMYNGYWKQFVLTP